MILAQYYIVWVGGGDDFFLPSFLPSFLRCRASDLFRRVNWPVYRGEWVAVGRERESGEEYHICNASRSSLVQDGFFDFFVASSQEASTCIMLWRLKMFSSPGT